MCLAVYANRLTASRTIGFRKFIWNKLNRDWLNSFALIEVLYPANKFGCRLVIVFAD